MKKSTLYVKIIAVAIILTGLLELLPTPTNPVEGSAKAFHFNFASEVMTAALLTGAAITIFRAVTQGGKLNLEHSEIDKGSTFSISLPLKPLA